MEYVRRFYAATMAFCRGVIEWRSPFTVIYVMAVNSAFWSVAFYTNKETQVECLLGVAAMIVLWDILLSPTHNRSVASQICHWPIQDLFRTTAFVTSMAAVRQLKLELEEQAFWLASVSTCALLIGPVYKYNRVTSKILSFFRTIFDFISYVVYLVIVNPTVKTYEAIKYVILLKWVPGLWEYLRSFGSAVYQRIDRYFLQYLRHMGNRTLEICRYWVYFHWVSDLRNWSRRWIFDPITVKLKVVWDKFVYVFGGYWVVPALQFLGLQFKKASFVLLGWCNQAAIVIGNSVLWPVVVVCGQQLKELYWVFHAAAVQPVLDKLYVKYKIVEDLAYIYMLGPICQTFIDNVPEKNPFAEDSENELQEYLPEVNSRTASESEFSTLASLHSDDDEHDFAKGLQQIAISDSESDNDEFMPIPRRRKPVVEPTLD